MDIKQAWQRWMGRRALSADTVTPLGFIVKTNGVPVDLGYLDLVLHNVSYWGSVTLNSKNLPIEIMPPCKEHGGCCFVDGDKHKHGEDDGKTLRLSQRMCVAHHLIGKALTGEKEGSDLLAIFDRLDWIGKDYD